MLFFTYFTKIPTHWTTKNWGSVPPPLGVPPPLKNFYILNWASLMGDVTRIDDVVSVAIWGVGGTPPHPPIFFVQKCYFSHISPKFELIGLQKIGGRYPLP